MRPFVLLGWAWACFGIAYSDIIYKKVGETVLLKPSMPSQKITSIIWKYGPNFAVQWLDSREPIYYRHFQERGKLDEKTGTLTISELTLSDTNNYTPEINLNLYPKFELTVLRGVPKPFITKNGFSLICNGDTEDAEPVNYSWSYKNMTLPNTKEIPMKEPICPPATCTMKNPVSEMTSGNFDECRNPIPIIVSVFVAVFIVGSLGLVVFHKKKTKEWFFEKGLKCWETDFWEDTTTHTPKDNDVGTSENSPMA